MGRKTCPECNGEGVVPAPGERVETCPVCFGRCTVDMSEQELEESGQLNALD